MLSTDKDFEGVTTNRHPQVYYIKMGEPKPVNNVINAAQLIEFDPANGDLNVYLFDRDSKSWILIE